MAEWEAKAPTKYREKIIITTFRFDNLNLTKHKLWKWSLYLESENFFTLGLSPDDEDAYRRQNRQENHQSDAKRVAHPHLVPVQCQHHTQQREQHS